MTFEVFSRQEHQFLSRFRHYFFLALIWLLSNALLSPYTWAEPDIGSLHRACHDSKARVSMVTDSCRSLLKFLDNRSARDPRNAGNDTFEIAWAAEAQLAIHSARQGSLKEAVARLQRAREVPRTGNTHINEAIQEAIFRNRIGDYDGALKALSSVPTPTDEFLLYQHIQETVRALVHTGEISSARSISLRNAKSRDANPEVRAAKNKVGKWGRAYVAYSFGNFAEALVHITDLADSGFSTIDEFLFFISILGKNGQHEHAIQISKEIVQFVIRRVDVSLWTFSHLSHISILSKSFDNSENRIDAMTFALLHTLDDPGSDISKDFSKVAPDISMIQFPNGMKAQFYHLFAETLVQIGLLEMGIKAYLDATALDSSLENEFEQSLQLQGFPMKTNGGTNTWMQAFQDTLRLCLPNGCRPALPKKCFTDPRPYCPPTLWYTP